MRLSGGFLVLWFAVHTIVAFFAIGVLSAAADSVSDLPKYQSGVYAKLDKAIYGLQDKIEISLINLTHKRIYSTAQSNTPAFSVVGIERITQDGKREQLNAQCSPAHCMFDIDPSGEIPPGGVAKFVWNPVYYVNASAKAIPIPIGCYRLVIAYQLEHRGTWLSVSTNEFRMKLK